jgi:hypothetical protein
MKRILTSVIALTAIIGAGVVHGWMTDRWGAPEQLARAAARVAELPRTIGEWDSTEQEIDPDQLVRAEAISSLSRVYRHRTTGQAVTVMLLCGRPGPIAVHPPTVCFTGSGYALMSPPARQSINSAAHELLGEFWRGDFMKESNTERVSMRTFWGWSTDGHWSCPDNPRFEFATDSHLYKMYVTRSLSNTGESLEDDSCVKFLMEFIPATQATVASSAADPSETKPAETAALGSETQRISAAKLPNFSRPLLTTPR